MKISQKFTVARPLAEVWAFFQDVPAVARCMPGAELAEDKGDGLYAGKVKVRLGPFGANFEGEAKVSADPAAHSGHVEGKGVDKRGGSRTRMVMDYRLQPSGDGTEVTVDADVSLAGAIAQVGRTGLIQETANILVQDFARALEAQLAPAAATVATPQTMALAAAPAPAVPQYHAPPRVPEPPHGQAASAPAAPGVATGQPPQGRQPASASAPATTRAAPSASPPPREIRGGSLALRALWAWLRSLLRSSLGARKRP